LPEEKPGKHRWTDPVIIVPIITAVIASIVGPTYYYYFLTPKSTPESPPSPPGPGPSPTTEPTPVPARVSVTTDKESYTNGEVIKISGNVGKPQSGKALRIDIYNPRGDVLSFVNGKEAYPNGKGFYTYIVDLNAVMVSVPEVIPGEYEVLVTYLNQSAKDKFVIE
jgi:hypothetical protein